MKSLRRQKEFLIIYDVRGQIRSLMLFGDLELEMEYSVTRSKEYERLRERIQGEAYAVLRAFFDGLKNS